MSNVVSRFAPSPTGYLHAGNYRTAVFAYLFAKHSGGKFVLRIEDTDAARSKPEYEANIKDALAWLNLPADESYVQSEHRARHREVLEKLIADNTAYVSKETPKTPKERAEVIRFRNPGGSVTFTDVIRGEITTPVDDLGDFIIARSLDEPVFHLAVVVDDADEGVTHVVRGGDHISNTARQMLIAKALGFATPLYAHLPLILDGERKKLSKRTGAKALTEYRDMGILPEALLNYLAFLGWNPGDEREYLSREELVAAFDITRVQKGSAIFDEVKLFSINQYWMRKLTDEDFITKGKLTAPDAAMLLKAVPLLKERAQTFAQAKELLEGELKCLFEKPSPEREQLIAKESPADTGSTPQHLAKMLELVATLPEGSSSEEVKAILMPYADSIGKEQGGRGAVLWPLRYALSGEAKSPDPFTLISILGVAESTARIEAAIAILGA